MSRVSGQGILVGDRVYLLGGAMNDGSCEGGGIDVLNLETLDKWTNIQVPDSPVRNAPMLVSFSETEIAIFGGYGSECPLNQISIFNTQT